MARDWRKQGLKPHRIERYMATNDPCLEAEPAENIGPCRNKPVHAAVFCEENENTATQAVVAEQFGGLPIMDAFEMKNTGGKEIVMSLQDELDAQGAGLKCKVPAEDLAEHEQRQAQRNPHQRIPGVAITVKMNLGRRRFLIGSAVAGIGGVAAAAVHDGELGAPPQTFRGSVPWQEGTADAPPGAVGSGYVFFAPAEAAFIKAAVGRLIPNDQVGPGAVEAGVPFFLDRQLAGPFGHGAHYYLGGRGRRARRNRATKAGSAPRNSIAPPLRRSTNTSAPISTTPRSANSRRIIRTRC